MSSLLRCGLLMVALYALVSLGCGGGDQKGKGDKSGQEKGAGKTEPRKADFALTAEEFSREFLKDEKEAEKKYQGKAVELTGTVAGVSTPDAGKTAVIQLEGAKKKETDIVGILVQIALRPEHTRTGLHLSRKQKVKISADYERSIGGFVVNLTKGSLEELSKSEVVAVKAADLAGEFTKDPKAAEKYDKKEIIVTGETEDVVEKQMFHYAKLKGDGKTRVSVVVGAADAPLLQKGKTVSLRCELGFTPYEKGEARLQGGSVVEIK